MQMESEIKGDSQALPGAPGRRPSSRIKAILVGMLIIGAITVYAGGTFANFTAETDNGATIQTGTLVLENQLGTTAGQLSATDCYSTSGLSKSTTVPSANSSNCASYFVAANGGVVTGSGGSTFTGTQDLTLKNLGTIGAATSQLTVTCANGANGATAPFTGSGDLCAGLKVIVAETLADFTTLKTANTALVGACTGATVATCPLSGGQNASTVAFTANPGAFPAGTTRYFHVSVGLAGSNDNALQGRTASMSFQWLATE